MTKLTVNNTSVVPLIRRSRFLVIADVASL
jgi:hypothetical protein